jgi:nucleoside-triphosphatase THEP1
MTKKQNTITITVAGSAGVGKSTIAFLLAEFLSHTGFDVAVNLLDEITEDQVLSNFEDKLEAVAEKTNIVVNEVMVQRSHG